MNNCIYSSCHHSFLEATADFCCVFATVSARKESFLSFTAGLATPPQKKTNKKNQMVDVGDDLNESSSRLDLLIIV